MCIINEITVRVITVILGNFSVNLVSIRAQFRCHFRPISFSSFCGEHDIVLENCNEFFNFLAAA